MAEPYNPELSLFNQSGSEEEFIPLEYTEGLLLRRNFIDQEQSTSLFSLLTEQIPWQQDALVFGGKSVLVPRLQVWMADSLEYRYSGLKLEPVAWHPAVTDLRESLVSRCGYGFNSVLLNYYRDGKDSVAWHSDDEQELGPAPIIASVSLGTPRTFDIRHKLYRDKLFRCQLGQGDLLIMLQGVQQHYQHRIPKEQAVTGARINLTFRNVM